MYGAASAYFVPIAAPDAEIEGLTLNDNAGAKLPTDDICTAALNEMRELDAALSRVGASVRIVAEASTPVAAAALVARSLGVALVSDLAVRAAPERDLIVRRPIDPAIAGTIDYVVTDATRAKPSIKAFLDLAHAAAAAIHREIVGESA